MSNAPKWLFYMVGPHRLELWTKGLGVLCSNQLSYRPERVVSQILPSKFVKTRLIIIP